MPVDYSRIPDEMKHYRQWVVWRYEDRNGVKPTKVPYCALNGHMASVTDPSTWCTFLEAVNIAVNTPYYNGIGFVLTPQDPYTILDLDYTDKEGDTKRQIKVWQEMDSYSERSPSGTGLHIIIKGQIPSGRRRSSIEVYASERYMTMTGDVYHDRPIHERQALLSILWEQMGHGSQNCYHKGDAAVMYADKDILVQALSASNGEKFRTLLDGNWQALYSSQSEADFAFIDIVAHYTQNSDQIKRIFKASPLGERAKSNRKDYIEKMVLRSFDNILPPIDMIGLQDSLEKYRMSAERQAQAAVPIDDAFRDTMPAQDAHSEAFMRLSRFWQPRPIDPPPGLMGDIARFIYAQSVRPVAEIAICGAIALMAGVCGRAYNVSGTGLNLYILLLALTGRGKEAINGGITMLINCVKKGISTDKIVPAAGSFVGPSEIASGQAILKYMGDPNNRSFVSIVGEFGLKMQQLSSPRASSSEIMLRRVLLDLYNKSGKNNVLGASAYAQKENNTDSIQSPAMSIIGEATPSTFYAAVDERMIADGLMPRFLIIEYQGKRPPRNRDHETVVPDKNLINELSNLILCSLNMQQKNVFLDVGATPEALEFLDQLDTLIDDVMNTTTDNTVGELWNRAHIKTLKLAALVAVGVNKYSPVITLEAAQWAYNVVSRDIMSIINRFNKGEVGKDNDNARQMDLLTNTCDDYLRATPKALMTYKVDIRLHVDGIIPLTYLSRRLLSVNAFRQDKMGGTNALRRCIQAMIDNGELQEVPRNVLVNKYGFNGRAYMVTAPGRALPRLDS